MKISPKKINHFTTKRCGKCGLEKELNDFYASDSYSSPCKQCRWDQEKAYRKSHREIINGRHRNYQRRRTRERQQMRVNKLHDTPNLSPHKKRLNTRYLQSIVLILERLARGSLCVLSLSEIQFVATCDLWLQNTGSLTNRQEELLTEIYWAKRRSFATLIFKIQDEVIYVKELLREQFGIKGEIPEDLIEQKIEQLKAHRAYTAIRREIRDDRPQKDC